MRRRLKIGIDASRVSANATGVGRYTVGIIRALQGELPNAELILYVRGQTTIPFSSRTVTIRRDTALMLSRLPVCYWIRFRLGRLAIHDDLDVFWSPNTLLPRNIDSIAPSVTTVLDFHHLIDPETLPIITRHAHRKWFNADVRKATKVVTISLGTSNRMRDILGRAADAIARPDVPVLPQPASRDEAVRGLESLGIKMPFIMTVGYRACKNIGGTISAVDMLRRRGRLMGYQLVMVGVPPSAARTRLGGGIDDSAWIRPLGFVDNATLARLYLLADALVFPSLYEGFGIPVIEARAAGCRVLTSDTPELREAGGGDATYVVPTPAGIAAGLEECLAKKRPAPSRTPYCWADAATAMAQVLSEAACCRRAG